MAIYFRITRCNKLLTDNVHKPKQTHKQNNEANNNKSNDNIIKYRQVAQLSQRDRAAGWVINGQKWKTGTERQYLRTI